MAISDIVFLSYPVLSVSNSVMRLWVFDEDRIEKPPILLKLAPVFFSIVEISSLVFIGWERVWYVPLLLYGVCFIISTIITTNARVMIEVFSSEYHVMSLINCVWSSLSLIIMIFQTLWAEID